MSTEAVKYLNKSCLAKVSRVVPENMALEARDPRELSDCIRMDLSRMLGHEVMKRATMLEVREPRKYERVYSAEVYVLSVKEAQELYRVMREEVLKEVKNLIDKKEVKGR